MGADPNDAGEAARPATPAQTDLPFAEAVAELLKVREMSMRALARELDISSGYLSDVLKGLHQMPPKTMDRLAEALGVAPTYFRERRALEVFDFLRQNPRALATAWSDIIEQAEEGCQRGGRVLQHEKRVVAIAKAFWEASPQSADVAWADLDEERRNWYCAIARQGLADADSISGPDRGGEVS